MTRVITDLEICRELAALMPAIELVFLTSVPVSHDLADGESCVHGPRSTLDVATRSGDLDDALAAEPALLFLDERRSR